LLTMKLQSAQNVDSTYMYSHAQNLGFFGPLEHVHEKRRMGRELWNSLSSTSTMFFVFMGEVVSSSQIVIHVSRVRFGKG
jgi:hypothetical protein